MFGVVGKLRSVAIRESIKVVPNIYHTALIAALLSFRMIHWHLLLICACNFLDSI